MSSVWSGSLLCRVIDPRPISYLEHWLSAEWNDVRLVPLTGKILKQSLTVSRDTGGKKALADQRIPRNNIMRHILVQVPFTFLKCKWTSL